MGKRAEQVMASEQEIVIMPFASVSRRESLRMPFLSCEAAFGYDISYEGPLAEDS